MPKYKFILLLAALFAPGRLLSQSETAISGYIRDETSGEVLVSATVAATSLKIGTASDENGFFRLNVPSSDSLFLLFSYAGYKSVFLKILPENFASPIEIRMNPENDLEEVIISTTRTNSRIEDLPVKIEVLGTEELNEEVSLVPGGMGSLLGDLSIITIQRTGAISGNDAVRMQGLAPGYTQILQDGLPLYGGFSGSLGVLSIPPLDLRQVEIVKGSSSTLYGGGAIGGLVNFLSKKPEKSPQNTVLLNVTSLGESNFNAFSSKKTAESNGFTLLVAGTSKPARDINSDGFAEIARSRQWLIHPHFFWGTGNKTSGDFGLVASQNSLTGGDFTAIQDGAPSMSHPFFQKDNSRRLTINGQVASQISPSALWTLRGAGSFFQRGGSYSNLAFEGRQLNSYLETNVVLKKATNIWVTGANFTGEQFQLHNARPAVPFGNSGTYTFGVFFQNDHRFSENWALQSGLRFDNNRRYGTFVLPRASLLFKPSANLAARLGYGRGYKAPDLFSTVEPVYFPKLQPLDAAIRADLANSLNADLNYHKLLFDAVSVQLNQAFYLVKLAHPFDISTDSAGHILLQNIAGYGRVLGTDSYVQLKYRELELYIGYNHTLSERLLSNGTSLNEPFNPKDKVAFTAAWAIPEKWRFGVETAFIGNQHADGNRKVPSYWFWAAMIARQFHWGTIVLNCENIGDARQSRHEPLVTGGFNNPVFLPVWGAIEGRVINVSAKIDW